VLRNLFEHYLHDMSEWFEIDTQADGSYSYDAASIWKDGYDAYLAKVGDSITGFALVGPEPSGWVISAAMTYTSSLSSADFEGAASGREWRRYCGMNVPAHGWSESWKQMRRP